MMGELIGGKNLRGLADEIAELVDTRKEEIVRSFPEIDDVTKKSLRAMSKTSLIVCLIYFVRAGRWWPDRSRPFDIVLERILLRAVELMESSKSALLLEWATSSGDELVRSAKGPDLARKMFERDAFLNRLKSSSRGEVVAALLMDEFGQ